ncbi:MAG: flippase [Candidatus Eisenbacteria bacterium]|nr:flippase [Candidatus Eisenbacteria bacterium]MCC7142679.1 flippase [Candidatus Eisenbacteria bacterium]
MAQAPIEETRLSFFRQSAWTFLTRVLVTLINIPISILVARRLGPEGQGAYSAALAFAGLWATSALLSVDAAHTYYLAGRKAPLRAVLGNSIAWSLGIGLLATPLYLLLSPAVQKEPSALFAQVLTLSAAAVPLQLLKAFVVATLLGQERIERYNLLQVVSNLVLLALLLLVLFTPLKSALWAVAAYLGSAAVFVVAGGVLLRRSLGEERLELSPALARESVVYGLKGHVGVFFAQFTYRFDQVLVTRMVGLEAQGFYSIAVLLAEKLTMISQSIHLVLFPRVSASAPAEANRLTAAACRFTFLFVIVAGIGLWVLGGFLVRLFYSSAFEPALPAFRILLPGVAILSLSRLLSGDLSGRGVRIPQTFALGSAFVINLGLDLLLIPRLGIVGAAWASTAAYVWQTLFLMAVFWKVSGVSPDRLLVPRGEDLSLVRSALSRMRPRRGGTQP